MAEHRFGPFEPVGITPDEWEVLDLMRQGLERRAIADRLRLSEKTVRFRIDNVGSKLRVIAQL